MCVYFTYFSSDVAFNGSNRQAGKQAKGPDTEPPRVVNFQTLLIDQAMWNLHSRRFFQA